MIFLLARIQEHFITELARQALKQQKYDKLVKEKLELEASTCRGCAVAGPELMNTSN